MSKSKSISPEIEAQIASSLPDTNYLANEVRKRGGFYFFVPEGAEHIALVWVCLADASSLIQTAIPALLDAKRDWISAFEYYDENQLQMAVSNARYSFDYAILVLSAASNHLAAAMWHFHNEIADPMDRYDAAWGVYNKWKNKSDAPVSFSILEGLLQDEDWKKILEYRHKWVHRGLPVIKGEFRLARRSIWQDADAPEPSSYFMKRTRPDGKVSYDSINLTPEYEMENLLDTATGALRKLHLTAEKFLKTWDAQVLGDENQGWCVTEKGMTFRSGEMPGAGDGT